MCLEFGYEFPAYIYTGEVVERGNELLLKRYRAPIKNSKKIQRL